MFISRPATRVVATALCGSLLFLPFVPRQDNGALDNDSLKTMLDNMGYEPSALSKGYLVVIKRESWTYNMQLILSDDKTKLGLNANLGSVDAPSDVSADTWLNLLKANQDTDPSFFYFDKDNKKLYLHRVLDNRALTASILRQQIENFVGNIHDTADQWGFTK